MCCMFKWWLQYLQELQSAKVFVQSRPEVIIANQEDPMVSISDTANHQSA